MHMRNGNRLSSRSGKARRWLAFAALLAAGAAQPQITEPIGTTTLSPPITTRLEKACGKRPRFPKVAIERQRGGSVQIRYTVGDLGRVETAEVMRFGVSDDAQRALEEVTLAWIKGCQFDPDSVNSKIAYTTQIDWSLWAPTPWLNPNLQTQRETAPWSKEQPRPWLLTIEQLNQLVGKYQSDQPFEDGASCSELHGRRDLITNTKQVLFDLGYHARSAVLCGGDEALANERGNAAAVSPVSCLWRAGLLPDAQGQPFEQGQRRASQDWALGRYGSEQCKMAVRRFAQPSVFLIRGLVSATPGAPRLIPQSCGRDMPRIQGVKNPPLGYRVNIEVDVSFNPSGDVEKVALVHNEMWTEMERRGADELVEWVRGCKSPALTAPFKGRYSYSSVADPLGFWAPRNEAAAAAPRHGQQALPPITIPIIPPSPPLPPSPIKPAERSRQ
jgi:hypothetical protein